MPKEELPRPPNGSPCPEVDDRGMREVSAEWGGEFGISIRLRMPREFEAALDSEYVYDALETLKMGIQRVTAQLNPGMCKLNAELEQGIRKLFSDAGVQAIYLERIPNQYVGPRSPAAAIRSPWFLVTTPIGHIEIGWRKRVLHIGWERTKLGKNFDLVSRGEVTHGPGSCHAWGYEDAAKVLRELFAEADKIDELIGQETVPGDGWRQLERSETAHPGDVFFGCSPANTPARVHPVLEAVRVRDSYRGVYFRKL